MIPTSRKRNVILALLCVSAVCVPAPPGGSGGAALPAGTEVAKRTVDLEFTVGSWPVMGDPGDHLCQAVIVANLGDTDAEDVTFDLSNLTCSTNPGEVILSSQLSFEPASISVPAGYSVPIDLCVDIPDGAFACVYTGMAWVREGGVPHDDLLISVTVNCVPGMAVEDNAYGVVGGHMELTPGTGGSDPKQFELTNLGNCAVTGVDWEASGFPDGIAVDVTIDGMVPWEGSVLGTVTATCVEPLPTPGTYHGTVTVTADGGLLDSFDLDVHVVSAMEIAENDLDIVDNVMTLAPDLEAYARVTGEFRLVNTGATDLTGIAASDVTGLPPGLIVLVTIGESCEWGGSIVGQVEARWVHPAVPAGEYPPMVTITADGGLADSFGLEIVIAELAGVRFTEDTIEMAGCSPVQTTFSVENVGNSVLADGRVSFEPTDLLDAFSHVIPAGAIEILPESAEIPMGDGVEFAVVVDVPGGLPDGLYVGSLDVYLDAEFADGAALELTLDCTPVEAAVYALHGDDGSVVLHWIAGSLVGVEALNVYRATAPDGPYVRVNREAIPPAPSGEYADTTVWPETVFWYEIRALFWGGTEDVLSGSPISIASPGRLVARLSNARPNPLRERTWIEFDVPDRAGRVFLGIYDLTGRLVKSLARGAIGRGRHTVSWDLSDERGGRAASGVYFVRLTAGDVVLERKLTVVK